MANNFSQETMCALFHSKPDKTNWGNTWNWIEFVFVINQIKIKQIDKEI